MPASANAHEGGAGLPRAETASDQFPAFAAANRPRIERALGERLPVSAAVGTERLNEAVRAAVFPGGKRLRPLITLAGSRLCGAADEQALTLSCVVEFIHTSSLVLDDLPGMDDAELRRNSPALHIAYGEGVAVLAAVALLNQSYALMASAARGETGVAHLPRLIEEAAACVGSSGMIAGQAAELALSGAGTGGSDWPSRELKTTGLMRLMMVAGAVISGAPEGHVAALAAYGESLGKAYQIYDDLADAAGDHGSTGKSVRQDSRHSRPTTVEGLSHAQVRALAAGVLDEGKRALSVFGDHEGARLLRSAADHIVAGLNPAGASAGRDR
jgi:geranylgeranyl diphosphate synthase type II